MKSTPGVETKQGSKTTLLVGEVRVEFAEQLEAEYVVALLRGLDESTP